MARIEDVFSCPSHEEADINIIHICNLDYDAYVYIKCSDNSILIIMLGDIINLKSKVKIWKEVGNFIMIYQCVTVA